MNYPEIKAFGLSRLQISSFSIFLSVPTSDFFFDIFNVSSRYFYLPLHYLISCHFQPPNS